MIEEKDIPEVLMWLQQNGYIKILNSSEGKIILREKLEVKATSFAEEYTALWEGIPKIGGKLGYYAKQAAKFNQDRLEKFMKAFPEVTKDQIIAATKKYIEERRLVNWQFTKKSHKFIIDIEGSELYNYVQNLDEDNEKETNEVSI